jgi:hypothetical protein
VATIALFGLATPVEARAPDAALLDKLLVCAAIFEVAAIDTTTDAEFGRYSEMSARVGTVVNGLMDASGISASAQESLWIDRNTAALNMTVDAVRRRAATCRADPQVSAIIGEVDLHRSPAARKSRR